MAVLVALSIALVWLVHFPIFPSAAFLEYDPADIPILVGAFAFGPVAGMVITVVASLIQGVTVSAQSGPYGIIMHVIATGTYVLTAGTIYKMKKGPASAADAVESSSGTAGAILAVVVGTLAMALVMCIANLIITPIFMGAPRAAVQAMLLPVILPFNLIKAGVNGAITVLLYKYLPKYIESGTAA